MNNDNADDVDYFWKRCLNIFIAHALLFVITIVKMISYRNKSVLNANNVNSR